jgi:hypothetical protein
MGLRKAIQVWVHKTNSTAPLFIEVPVPSLESERSCVSMFASFYDFDI